MDKISIIVPVYMVEKELCRCIDSILKQTYSNLEIILVEDGSQDNCPIICDEYEVKDHRVSVIHKANGGLSDARNAGLKAATGEYVLYVDSDDYIEPNACECLLCGIIDQDVDFVVGALREVGKNIVYQRHSNIISGKKINAKDFIMKSITVNEWYAPAVLNLYRRKFLIDNELFFKKGRFYEDMEMLPRLYMAAHKIVYLDIAFYNYVIRENSITTATTTKIKTQHAMQNYIEWKKCFDQIDDYKLRNLLYGFLIRNYLHTCRLHNITEWKLEKIDFQFAIKYSIGIKEKIKAIFFTIAPRIYISMRI